MAARAQLRSAVARGQTVKRFASCTCPVVQTMSDCTDQSQSAMGCYPIVSRYARVDSSCVPPRMILYVSDNITMLTVRRSSVLAVFLFGTASVLAGSVTQGGSCSTDNNRLDPATHKFITDCDDKTFCSASGTGQGTCQPKQCRRDEFPFGFEPGETVPPMCGHGTYCPDEGSGCQGLVHVGQPCQLNRDNQCEPPSNAEELASEQNFDGAICLQSTCM